MLPPVIQPSDAETLALGPDRLAANHVRPASAFLDDLLSGTRPR